MTEGLAPSTETATVALPNDDIPRTRNGHRKSPLDGKRGPDKQARVSAKARHEIIQQAVTGAKLADIAQVVRLSRGRVRKILAEPQVATFVGEARQAMKVKSIAHAEGLLDQMWRRTRRAAQSGDPADLKSLTQALRNVESIAASASGEAGQRQVNVTGGVGVAVGVDAVGELRELLRGIFGAPVVEAERV